MVSIGSTVTISWLSWSFQHDDNDNDDNDDMVVVVCGRWMLATTKPRKQRKRVGVVVWLWLWLLEWCNSVCVCMCVCVVLCSVVVVGKCRGIVTGPTMSPGLTPFESRCVGCVNSVRNSAEGTSRTLGYRAGALPAVVKRNQSVPASDHERTNHTYVPTAATSFRSSKKGWMPGRVEP